MHSRSLCEIWSPRIISPPNTRSPTPGGRQGLGFAELDDTALTDPAVAAPSCHVIENTATLAMSSGRPIQQFVRAKQSLGCRGADAHDQGESDPGHQ